MTESMKGGLCPYKFLLCQEGYCQDCQIYIDYQGTNDRKEEVMNKTITNNSSEKVEVKTDRDRFSIVTTFKGYLPDEINRKKVTILNKSEGIHIYDVLGQWIRQEIRH